jgi:hypothetical protein
VLEGKIDGFFKGEAAGFFSYFFDQERARSAFLSKEDEIISYCSQYEQQGGSLEERSNSEPPEKKTLKKFPIFFRRYFLSTLRR